MTENSEKRVEHANCILSNDIIKLYNSAGVQNVNEAVTILFHTFLLESGFTPKNVSKEDIYQLMPANWNANGIFRIKYTHYCCPSFSCYVTCVPLYNTVSLHGIVCDMECSESVDMKINLKIYLKQSRDFSDVFEVFCKLDDLSRYFKDNFCLPLLNLLHETIGKDPLYGMQGLFDELKMYILQCLPVEGITSLSAVNKSFHSLANSTFLWKYLFERDFSKGSLLDIDSSSEPNWKQIYKKEYMKKKRKPEPRSLLFPHRIPRFFQVDTIFDYEDELTIDFNPPLPGIYPNFLQPRYPFLRRLC